MIVETAVIAPNSCVAVVSADGRNAVYAYSRGKWELSSEWNGSPLTSVCPIGHRLVVAEEDGLRIVIGDQVQRVKVKVDWVYCASALDDRTVLLGGAVGRLGTLDLVSNRVSITSLAELGVDKPGRDVLNIVPIGKETFLLGTNRLFVRYEPSRLVELLRGGPSTEPRVTFWFGTALGERVILSGLHGVEARVWQFQGAELQPLEGAPFRTAAPRLRVIDETLYCLGEGLWTWSAGVWDRRVSLSGKDLFVGLERVPEGLMLVSAAGTSFLFDGVWKPVEPVPS